MLVVGRFDDKWLNTVQELLSESCNCYLTSIILKLNIKIFLKITQLLSSENTCSGKPHDLPFMKIINFSNLIVVAHSLLDIWKYFREIWPRSNYTPWGGVTDGVISKKCNYYPHFIIFNRIGISQNHVNM